MNVDDLALALGVGAARGAKALARAVPGEKRRVVALSDAVARALEQAGHEAVRAELTPGKLALDDAGADALCASGMPDPAAAREVLRECARVVRNGGRVVIATAAGIVGRGPERAIITALFMHAGLTDLQQQMSRGTAITSGRVRR
jgi:ubiquinone/menaquinone biosynthesis C-methylase UbiE